VNLVFNLYDVVKLKSNRPDVNVTTDNIGTIIDYVADENVYSVEFVDEKGDTIEESVLTYFKPDELELITKLADA